MTTPTRPPTTPRPSFPANKTLAICGNIAAGKSTFGRHFEQYARKGWTWGEGDVILFEEEKLVQALLSAYLKDPATYGAHFQTVMAMEASARQKHAETLRTAHSPHALVLIERAALENTIFAEANCRMGNLSRAYKHDFYDEIIASLEASTPDLFVFLYVRDDVRVFRQDERHRTDEDLYQNEYLNTLGDVYFEWMVDLAAKKQLLVLDWNSESCMKTAVRTIAEVLNGTRTLPEVTIEELCSSGESSEDGTSEVMTVCVGAAAPHSAYTGSVKKRRKMQYKVMEALAKFEPVTVSF